MTTRWPSQRAWPTHGRSPRPPAGLLLSGATWTSLPGTPMNTDLAHTAVSDHRWLGPAYSVDFQPWWMCLLPPAAVEAIGLPMPFFLKWDDVEFGLRAKAAGF